MKKSLFITFASVIILATSCKKEDVENYYVKCKIDGVDFNSTTCTYNQYATGHWIDANMNGYPQHIMFNVSNDSSANPVVGSYPTQPGSYYNISVLDAGMGTGPWTTHNGTSTGSINVIEVTSTKVKGTFNANIEIAGYGTKTVTNGEYNVKK